MAQKAYSDYSAEDMKALTKGVMTFLDSWKLPAEQVLEILGLEKAAKKRHLNSYRVGEKAFPESPELMVRLDHIIGIADALRTTFPFSDSMRSMWMHKPHRRFQKNSPLSVILSDTSPNGLLKVRMEVDCAYGYAISEALQAQAS